MNNCIKCEESIIWCACLGIPICESHCVSHLGPTHYLYDKNKAEKDYLSEKLKVSLKRPKKLKNLKGLNEGMPIIYEEKVGIIDLESKIIRLTQYDVSQRIGFTLNAFRNSLLLVSGMNEFELSKDIINSLDSSILYSIKTPRSFHSSIIHGSHMYIIGGVASSSGYSVIEKVNLEPPFDSILNLNNILNFEILSPVSIHDSEFIITRFKEQDCECIQDKFMAYKISDDSICTTKIEYLQGFSQRVKLEKLEKLGRYELEYDSWSPCEVISLRKQNFMYLQSTNQIIDINNPLSEVFKIN